MNLKSLYIYILQFILIYLQLIQIRIMAVLPISDLAVLGVLIVNVCYLLVKENFEDTKYSILFKVLDYSLIALGLYLCRTPLIQFWTLVVQWFQTGNNELWQYMSEIHFSQTMILAMTMFFVYGLLKLIHSFLRTGYFIYPLGLFSGAILLLALISGKANLILLLAIILLNLALLLLFSVQNPIELFKKKVFVPVVCIVLGASLIGALVNPFLGNPSSNLITGVIKTAFFVIERVSDFFDKETPDFIQDAEEIIFSGVENLGPLEFELSGAPDSSGTPEDIPLPEGSSDSLGSPISPSDDQEMNENTEGEGGGGIPGNQQCKNCSGSSNTSIGLCEDCLESAKSTSVTPGIGNGQLTNASMFMADPEVVLIVESDVPISHLKVFSGGQYNDKTFAFSSETSSSMEKTISEINKTLPYGVSFQQLFNRKVTDHTAVITNVAAKKVTYFPYGIVDFDKPVHLVGDNYFSMYFPFDYNKYTVYFNTDPIFKDGFKDAVNTYQRAVYEDYLQIPESMKGRLQAFLTSKGIDYTSSDKAGLISQIKFMLQTEYTYSLEPGELPENEELILYFLTQNQKGYCIHFASAATMLYRTCGIPARYVSGYAVPSSAEGISNVLNIHAHAWTEIFQQDRGWIGIEVTAPSSEMGFEMSESAGGGSGGNYSTPEDDEIQQIVSDQTTPEDTSQNTPDGQEVPEFPENDGSSEKEDPSSTKPEQNESQNPSEKEEQEESSDASNEDNDHSDNNQEEKPDGNPEESPEPEPTPEPTPDPTPEPEKPFDLDFDFGASDIDFGKLFFFILFALVFIACAATGILLYLRKRKLEAMTLEDKVYLNYALLQKHSFVTAEIYDMMLRVRFSPYQATEDDLNVLLQRKDELVQQIVQTEKLHRRLLIQLLEGLPVIGD